MTTSKRALLDQRKPRTSISFFIETFLCFFCCGTGLLTRRIIWKLMDFADFDGVRAVSFEHFASCLHVLANERLQRILSCVRHGFGDRNVHRAITRQNSQRRAHPGAHRDAIFAVAGRRRLLVLQGAGDVAYQSSTVRVPTAVESTVSPATIKIGTARQTSAIKSVRSNRVDRK